MNIQITNECNMQLMARHGDNHFDLAIVDPPYGIGKDWLKRTKRTTPHLNTIYTNQPAVAEYFVELQRVAKHWIIWGWNYYTEILGSTNYLICWDKGFSNNWSFHYSQFELASTNIRKPAKLVSILWNGAARCEREKTIHPHQKPVKLYEWLLTHYANHGDKILDTNVGSGSIALACHNLGFDLVACELDTGYCNAAIQRLRKHQAQQRLFLEG